MEEQRREEVQRILIGWAASALARWAGESPDEGFPSLSSDEENWLSQYGRLLSAAWQVDGVGEELVSIFSLIRPPEGPPVDAVNVPARVLSLDSLLLDEAEAGTPPEDIWRGFIDGFNRLPEDKGRFEAFAYLFRKFAWAVPCTYEAPVVSLYEEFKALTALIHAADGAEEPAEEFLLVGGDVPGIQTFLYTLTSKGAAKGLRGRSFFIQLLGDAVVRALLRDLGRLPEMNVIYAAGGNFVLLAPAGKEALLEEWRARFNTLLLEEYAGDLYLALEWTELPAAHVRAPQFAEARKELGAKVAAAKGRRFSEVVETEGWEALFEPKGEGGEDYCQVCQREPKSGESLVSETTEAGETVEKCEQCRSFETLARAIAYHPLWMVVSEADASMEESGWQGTLTRLTGFAYRFEHDASEIRAPGTVYVLNDTDLETAGALGFRFIANVTPRIEPTDIDWVEKHHPDLELPPGEPIKDFALMALQSEGIHRVGVLRMDVDNLGAIFGQYLQSSMAQLSTLSAAMDLFFTGYLNQICWQVGAEGEHDNVIYVIYAGGDDLFVVGSWDRMPMLAEEIKQAFTQYTGQNPNLTISGGVTLEDRKFPLYRAAERAGEAEGKAKRYHRPDDGDKSAFCFLNQVVGWEEWPQVREAEQVFLYLIGAGVPRSLLRTTQVLHALFISGRNRTARIEQELGREPTQRQVCWGRWTWMAAYSLTRLARGCPDLEEREQILQMQREWIESGERIHYLGLAARWAEYQLRGGEE